MSLFNNHSTERRTSEKPLIVALLLSMFFYPAMANTAEGTSAQKRQKNPNDVICKREKITGSHMKKRICLTRKEWDDIRKQSQASAASAMNGGSSITPR